MVEVDAVERLTWRIQRIGWLIMGVVVLPAALLGLLGGGPLADARLEAADASLEFKRVMRLGVMTPWQITVTSPGERLVATLDSALISRFDVERIFPAPEVMRPVAGGVEVDFPTGRSPVSITIHLRSKTIGLHHGTITVRGTQWSTSTLVLP